jgi:hypothetical protein
MDWFNSAGMMVAGWKTKVSVPALPPGPDALQTSGIADSFGFRIAERLLEEVAVAHLSFVSTAHHARHDVD